MNERRNRYIVYPRLYLHRGLVTQPGTNRIRTYLKKLVHIHIQNSKPLTQNNIDS